MTERIGKERTMQVYLEALRYLHQGPLKTDLTFAERNLLALVGTYGNTIQLTLALAGNFFGYKPPYMSELAKQLEGKGYLELSADKEDTRAKNLRLTREGLRKFEGLCAFVHSNSTENPFDAQPPLIDPLPIN